LFKVPLITGSSSPDHFKRRALVPVVLYTVLVPVMLHTVLVPVVLYTVLRGFGGYQNASKNFSAHPSLGIL
jgi:hypothetical protein